MGVRAPVAAYNTSIEHVVRRLLKATQLVNQAQKSGALAGTAPEDTRADLLDATDHMLDALLEHIEDCGGIIQSFFAPEEGRRSRQAVAQFKKFVLPYRDHVATIVNYIKHRQGRLRTVVMTTDQVSTIGYYVEGVLRSGGVGPVAAVHPNENSAFSYNRDIPFHVCNLFLVSAKLAEVLASIDSSIRPDSGTDVRSGKLGSLIELASTLPKIYFPDELLKDYPHLGVSDKGVVVEFPSERIRPATHARMNVQSATMFDGSTKEYSLPYLGQIELNKTFALLRQRRPFARIL